MYFFRLTTLFFVVILTQKLLAQSSMEAVNFQLESSSQTDDRVDIQTELYKVVIEKKGFRFSFYKNAGKLSFDSTLIAAAHPKRGLSFSAVEDSLLPAVTSTQILNSDSLKFEVINEKGEKALVYLKLYKRFCNFIVEPLSPLSTIDISTASIQPVYGLGDHGGVRGHSSNVFGINDPNFHQINNEHRFVSNFSIFPSIGMAQVLFESGKKRVTINENENKLGAANVKAVKGLYYFFGSMAEIYADYKSVRIKEGYPDYKPAYDFFEPGYEAFGSLGWNTYQTSVTRDLQQYKAQGYPLKWAVVGSGFWRGDRKSPLQGSSNSFGIWDDKHEPGRQDNLPNPRYPDVKRFKKFLKNEQIDLYIGLRIIFKAIPSDSGYNNFTNDGPFTAQALAKGYFLKGANGHPSLFKVNFPYGNVYYLDGRNAGAVKWFVKQNKRWGAKGFKEDTMMQDGDQLYDDNKLNKFNEALKSEGFHVMVRNSAYSVPGDILRIEDTKYDLDHDRPIRNILSYAASGAPNVYPDIVAGKYLQTPLTEDQKIYYVRNANYGAVCPAMAVGLGPWNLQNPLYESAVKKAVLWHSEMVPYIYSAALQSYFSGFPYTITPLPIAFPDDRETYNLANDSTHQYEWMLGPSLLATPAYGSDYATVQKRTIYLPKGNWVDLENGKFYIGPTWLEDYEIPVSKIPVFVGGKGTLILKKEGQLQARIYPVAAKGTVYDFFEAKGKNSVINLFNDGWNAATLKVKDLTSNKIMTPTFDTAGNYFSFAFEEGHSYELSGGE